LEGFPNLTDPTVISSVQIDSSFDLIQNLSLGMYSSNLISHDIIKRTVKRYNFDYKKTFDSYEHLEDWSFLHDDVESFKEVYDSKRFLVPQHYQLFGDDVVGNSSLRERVLQLRVSQLQQINTYKMTIKIAGDITTRAGDVVYIHYPSKGGVDREDRLMSGKYLVLNVKNSLEMTRHETVLEVAKDSYFREIPSKGV